MANVNILILNVMTWKTLWLATYIYKRSFYNHSYDLLRIMPISKQSCIKLRLNSLLLQLFTLLLFCRQRGSISSFFRFLRGKFSLSPLLLQRRLLIKSCNWNLQKRLQFCRIDWLAGLKSAVAVFRKPCEKRRRRRREAIPLLTIFDTAERGFISKNMPNTREVQRLGLKVKLICKVRCCHSDDREGNLHMVCDAV